VFIAGVFKQADKRTFKKLVAVTKNRLKKNISYYETELVSIIAGNTSSTLYQGEIISTERSLLAGRVFSKEEYKVINQELLEKYSHLTSKDFIKNFWGSYIFINTDVINRKLTILKDPIGQFPIFYTKGESQEIIFASEIEVLWEMMDVKPAFNWNYFADYLVHSSITSNQTAFEGIFELPHGCEVCFNIDSDTDNLSVVWNPLDYCDDRKSAEQTQKDIIETAKNVIRCWTQKTDGVILDFSGGTDSTGLLFLLENTLSTHQILKPVNVFHSEVASSDERKHALAIANELGIVLSYFDRSDYLPLDPIKGASRFKPNWPNSGLAHLKIQQEASLISEEYKNIVYMSGHGGDHIFIAPTHLESLCDYLIKNGIKGFFSKAKEISTMFREPLFPIFKKIIKSYYGYLRGFDENSFYVVSKHKRKAFFENEVFVLRQNIKHHPFFHQSKRLRILPGKRKHIENIYRGLSTIKKDVRDNQTNPVFYPFFSQPLIELALSIPTYRSFQEGYNRYPFREAISKTFKTSSVWRKDKGDTSGIIQRGIKKNEEYVRNKCFNGKSIRRGLINKKLLNESIRELVCGKSNHQWPLLNLISLEIFLEHWNSPK